MPTTPLCDAGMRIEPAWSPPRAISTSAAATSAADPVDEPPGVWPGLRGLVTVAVALVRLPPAKEKYSQVDLPRMVAPASSSRVTTVASISGT